MYMKIAVVCVVLFVLYCTAGCNGIVYPRKPLTGVNDPPSPQDEAKEHVLMAKLGRAYSLDHDASIALENEQYAKAEALERRSLSLGGGMQSTEILAQSLEAQGKNAEALREYKSLVNSKMGSMGSNLLHYSLQLLKVNRWSEAVAAYNEAVPQHRLVRYMDDDEMLSISYQFSSKKKQPKELETAIHIGLGLVSGPIVRKNPMYDFEQALKISPNSPVAKYYYNRYLKFTTARHIPNAVPK